MTRRTSDEKNDATAAGGRSLHRPRARVVSTGAAQRSRRVALSSAGLIAIMAMAFVFRPMPTALAASEGAAASGTEAPATGEPLAGGPDDTATATFGGGCFWCMEPPFDKTEGVLSTTSGYMGGEIDDPTYEQVSAGGTGHVEVVQVKYDPEVVDYETLLGIFWRNVDPLTANRQFCDGGSQYRSAIFAHDESQRELAETSLSELEASERFDDPIVTEIIAADTFWTAEDYHQDYYVKNPLRYRFYRSSCGRDDRLETLWGSDA